MIGKKGVEIEKLKTEIQKMMKGKEPSSISTRFAAPISIRNWWRKISHCNLSGALPFAAR